MLSRTIFTSSPSTVIVVSALCARVGFTESSSSMSDSLVRPMIFSCSSTGSAFQPGQVVQVLLHDDVAAAGVGRLLVADDGGARRPPGRSGSRCRPRSRAGPAHRSR